MPKAPAVSASQETAPETEEPATENSEPVSHDPVDYADHEVLIKAEPQKPVSGDSISTSLLIAPELNETMVGTEVKASKRRLLPTGSRRSGKTTQLPQLFPNPFPVLTTWTQPGAGAA